MDLLYSSILWRNACAELPAALGERGSPVFDDECVVDMARWPIEVADAAAYFFGERVCCFVRRKKDLMVMAIWNWKWNGKVCLSYI